MAFPFPDDRVALQRLNWCRRETQAHDTEALSCILRARMCADHIDATGDSKTMQRAVPSINQILSAAEVKTWDACGQGEVSGVCGLLLDKQHGSALWSNAGAEREHQAYNHIFKSDPQSGVQNVQEKV